MKSKQNVRHYLFDVEMLRRRLLRPYFIELGLTVGQGQPRILYELRKCDGMISLSARSCFKHIKNLKVKAGIIDENMLNINQRKRYK